MAKSISRSLSPNKLVELMIALHYKNKGLMIKQIAHKLGISRQAVSYNFQANEKYRIFHLPSELIRIAEDRKEDREYLLNAAVIIQRIIEETSKAIESNNENELTSQLAIKKMVERVGVQK
jgi:predicted transcriptional regulator